MTFCIFFNHSLVWPLINRLLFGFCKHFCACDSIYSLVSSLPFPFSVRPFRIFGQDDVRNYHSSGSPHTLHCTVHYWTSKSIAVRLLVKKKQYSTLVTSQMKRPVSMSLWGQFPISPDSHVSLLFTE